MKNFIHALLPEIISIRHTLHANPELAHEEHATAALISETLKKFGYEKIEIIAGTGVVALLDSGKPGKCVALRADIDALPIHEKTGLSYQSTHPGKMHACGHDGHTATLLAAAGALMQCKEKLRGQIKFIFQPAEETGTGAAAMIEAGVLEHPKVDAIFGYHGTPRAELGVVKTTPTCLFASQDVFNITIHGKGGHAAHPHLTIDPIYIGTLAIQALQGIASRLSAPNDPVVLSVTQFHAGTTHNVIPSEASFQGTLRAISSSTRTLLREKLVEIVTRIATSFGAKAEIHFSYPFPPTINHREETERVVTTARSVLGNEKVILIKEPSMSSEDFSHYLQKIPGCYFWVGMGMKEFMPHTSHYNFEDAVIPIAAELLAQIAIDYLNQE